MKSAPELAQRPAIPPQILQLMLALAAPEPEDRICDPRCGKGELLAAAAAHVRSRHAGRLHNARSRSHFREQMFFGFDDDAAALERAGARLAAFEIDRSGLRQLDALRAGACEGESTYSLVLTCTPSGGTTRVKTIAADLAAIARTKRLELLCFARSMRLLAPQGRAVVLVPESLLSASTKAHRALRAALVRDYRIDAIVRLPPEAMGQHGARSAALVVFARAPMPTSEIWYYDAQPHGRRALSEPDLVDLLSRWRSIRSAPGTPECVEESTRPRTAQSFVVPRAEIEAADFNLGLDRYHRLVPDAFETRSAHQILAELAGLEADIFQGMKDIVGMLKAD
jgi:type I restriction enzyme M protein